MRRKSLILIFLISLGNLVYCQQGPLSWKTNSSFFPIAVWMQNPNNAAAYKAMGINIFVGGNLDQQKLDLLKKSGMKVIANMNNFGLEHLKDSVIYGWAQEDEPDNAQIRKDGRGYEPCIDPAVIVRKYQEIKSKDPDRPVYLNLGMGVSYINWHGRGSCSGRYDMYKVSRNGYLKGCDIASFDIYPVNTNDKYLKDKLWFVPKGIDSLRSWSNDEKPVWCWIESTRITEDCPRKPTPAEVKTQVWMALIHGAGGFGYFCQSFYPAYNEASLLKDPVMVIAIKEINAQVTSLARELNSPATKGYASVTSSNSAVPIDLLTKNYKDNNYIFSVAMRPGKTTAEFQVKSGKKVEVLGENRSIKIKKGKFSDEFSGYGVHLYKIK
jgi:hypothetical protein